MYTNLPVLGVGIGWRKEIANEIYQHRESIDWCEVITEHYINVTPDKLDHIEKVSRMFPLVPHGIDLSIGTDVPIEEEYFDGLTTLIERIDPPWFTDHLCFTRVPGVNIGQLTPLQFSEEVADVVINKVKHVKERLNRPFLLENITYYFKIPGSELSEAEFLTTVLEKADVGLLLDVCNLHINARNHGYDPYRFLHSIPLERVVQLHMAGGLYHNHKWVDTHSEPIHNEAFELMEYIVAHAPVKGILLERDSNFPASFQELADELDHMRSIFRRYHPAPEAPPAVLGDAAGPRAETIFN
jgi:uncharacterized protein (UPF0276 family)